MAELSRRIELVILSCSDGSEEVTEREGQDLIVVVAKCSLETARAWVEAHYEGVEWRKTRLASALIGRLREGGAGA